jgi:hypothetical protein
MRRLAAFALLGSLVACASTSAAPSAPRLEVVASHLNNPRKLFAAGDGAIYVVEAGTGGSNKCSGTGPDAICVGRTGSITRITENRQTKVVTGLVSWATPFQQRAQGAADVLVRGDTYYVLLGDAVAKPSGANALGPDGRTAGHLVSTPRGKASPTVIANFARFEAQNNPDRGTGPGRKYGNPVIDSNPYAFTAYRDGFAVVDAGANDLLFVDAGGKVSVLAVFPTQTEKLTSSEARRIGVDPEKPFTVQSVPSSVAVGPDGALFVGELTGRPFHRGAARVGRVVPGRKTTLYASGFTNITDLAFDGRDLLILEATSKGLWAAPSPGALIRLAPDGTRTELARTGLFAPTGLAVSGRSVYVANYGFFPGAGPGPHGQVVRLALS